MIRVAAAVALLVVAIASAADIGDRAQALRALDDEDARTRAEGVAWIARHGTVADDKLLLPHLGDDDPLVRKLSERGMWMLWSRSGDAAIDELMEEASAQTQAGDLTAAVETYGKVIARKPAFAEGWNKRATVLFLKGDLTRSLADCDEVMKRNPYHFGALAGYGQIHFRLAHYDKAIEYWERAMKVNPNLDLADGIAAARKLREEARRRSA